MGGASQCPFSHLNVISLTHKHKLMPSPLLSGLFPISGSLTTSGRTHAAILCHAAEGITEVVCVCPIVSHKEPTMIVTVFSTCLCALIQGLCAH